MKPHTQIYLKHFGYSDISVVACEVCCNAAYGVYQIYRNGATLGGVTNSDHTIKYLMALCTRCKTQFYDNVAHRDYLQAVHDRLLSIHEPAGPVHDSVQPHMSL